VKGDAGVIKRSLMIRGHRTSISLEEPFWKELARLAARRGLSLPAMVAEIDQARGAATNLSSAVRLAVLADALERANSLPP
jgi:predicted DNA-binding ribbon-helix-helix protein